MLNYLPVLGMMLNYLEDSSTFQLSLVPNSCRNIMQKQTKLEYSRPLPARSRNIGATGEVPVVARVAPDRQLDAPTR